MARSEKFTIRMSVTEKQLLLEMARRAERAPSDLLRLLIRQAARHDGHTTGKIHQEDPK